jgi:hypothetical protein
MDEVAVYDHALSEDEIARHHSAGMDGVLVNELPLFRWLAP